MTNIKELKKMLASRIFIIRNLNNLTQKVQSKELGIGISAIQRFENAVTMPSIKFLANFADFYEIPLYILFTSDEEFDSYLERKQMNII